MFSRSLYVGKYEVMTPVMTAKGTYLRQTVLLTRLAFRTVITLPIAMVLGCSPSIASASPRISPPSPGLIALEGPMTGTQSATGIDMARGAQLAVDQINSAGGVDGVKLTLLREDDAATAQGGLRAARRALAAHAFAVVGPFNSSVGIANLPLYKKARLPIVRLTSSVKTEGFGATTQPMDSQVAPVEVQEITRVLGAKRPAILYDTSTYTAGIAAQVAAGLKKARDPAVATVRVTSSQATFGRALRKLAVSRPDLLYIAAYGTQAGGIALAASHMRLGTCFVDLAAQGSDFVSGATQSVAEHCVSSGVPSAQQFAGASQYVSNFKAMFDANPGTWGTFTYDSVQILASAIRQSGWQQRAVVTSLDHTTNVQGITGPITIAPSTGNRVQSTVVILNVDASGNYVVDPAWAKAVKFPLPASS
jgi:branched-chain amino acid transport system substrate-binding protein